MPFSGWMVEQTLHPHIGMLLNSQKEWTTDELLHETTWMHLKDIMFSEKRINHTKLNAVKFHLYHIFDITAEIEKRVMVAKRQGGGWGGEC